MDIKQMVNKEPSYSSLFGLEEGVYKGTIFKNLYLPYKYDVKTPNSYKSKEERLLAIITALEFYLIDLRLYLDLNSNDEKAKNDYFIYVKELNKMKKYFCDNYYQLQAFNDAKFDWNKENFPMECELNVAI